MMLETENIANSLANNCACAAAIVVTQEDFAKQGEEQ